MAAAEMGWASSPENARKESPLTPAIVLVSPPQPWEQYGSRLARGAEDCDFTARWVSVRQAHKAGPVTGSVCTGVAAALRGSVVNDVVRPEAHVGGRYRVAHPSGVIDVVIDLDQDSGEIVIRKAAIIRTARRLLEGFVYASKERLPFLGRDPGHEVAA
jgi:2-methylaconitate cis-trans-isomerase PrpF